MVEWRLEIAQNNEYELDLYDVIQTDTANPFGSRAIAKIDDTAGNRFDKYPYGTRVDLSQTSDESVETRLVVEDGDTTTINNETQSYQLAEVSGTLEITGSSGQLELTGDGFQNRFTGYVVERKGADDRGADTLELSCWTFDQFLRRNTVTNDQSGNTILEALEDIIKTDTPVTWNAANVTVGDNQTLFHPLRGEKVENAIRTLAFKSQDEEFGVNSDVEFFFRQQEISDAPRDIDNSQWFNYDIPELGKETVNEVQVWYNDGDESVTVAADQSQLDLQSSLNLEDPGKQRKELNRPKITDIEDAKDEGEKFLQFKNNTLTGTVTSFGLNNAEPGDVISVTINERGIDTDFRIAENEMEWGIDENRLTIVEKRGDNDDILVDLSDTLDRTKMKDVNRDAIATRVTSAETAVDVTVTAGVDGTSLNDFRATNTLLTAIRDGWAGDGNPSVTNVVVGDSATNLKRTNTALDNQTDSASADEAVNSTQDNRLVIDSGDTYTISDGDTENYSAAVVSGTLELAGTVALGAADDAQSVTYDANITQSGVQEVGLTDGNGDLLCRGILDSTDVDGLVSITLTTSDGSDKDNTVVTLTGQTVTRNIIADNSPNLPSQYRWGSGDVSVAESDTALKSFEYLDELDETQKQFAFTESEWNGLVDFDVTTPLTVTSDGKIAAQQSAFFGRTDDLEGGEATVEDGSLTNENWDDADAKNYDTSDPTPTKLLFTPKYDIPADNVAVMFRGQGTWPNGFYIDIDGNTAYENFGSLALGSDPIWEFLIGDASNLSGTNSGFTDASNNNTGATGYNGGDLTAGEQHTVTFGTGGDTTGGSNTPYLDCIYIFDDRFSYTIDNTIDSGVQTLDGPEIFPKQQTVDLPVETTRRDVTGGRIASSWNNTDNSQFVEVSDDGTNYTRASNSETVDADFGGTERQIDARLALSRFDDSGGSPDTGNAGQEVDTYDLFAGMDKIIPSGLAETTALGYIPRGQVDGTTLREIGLHNASELLSHSELAEFTVSTNQRVESDETTRWSNP